MSKITIYTDEMKLVIDCGSAVDAKREFEAIRDNLMGLTTPTKKLFGKKEERKAIPNIIYYGRNTGAVNSPVHSTPVASAKSTTGEVKALKESKIDMVSGVIGGSIIVDHVPAPIPTPKPIEAPKMDVVPPQTAYCKNNVEPGKQYGFMFIRCKHCGDVRSYYIRPDNATEVHVCRNCKQETPLTGLRKLVSVCVNCGKRFIYKTNFDPQDAPFEKDCLECQSPVPIKYNAHEDCFDTMM